jgi:hypothetical protein
VNVLIHFTRATDLSGTSLSTTPESHSEKDSLKDGVVSIEPSPLGSQINDLEKGALEMATGSPLSINEIRPGRPDIGKLIAAAVSSSSSIDDRIIVGACGPSGLMSAIREAVFSDLYNDGPSLTLYTEVSLQDDPSLKLTLTKSPSQEFEW